MSPYHGYGVWHLKISVFGDLLEYAKEIKIKHHEEKTIQRWNVCFPSKWCKVNANACFSFL